MINQATDLQDAKDLTIEVRVPHVCSQEVPQDADGQVRERRPHFSMRDFWPSHSA
jgi:hypothetical protein